MVSTSEVCAGPDCVYCANGVKHFYPYHTWERCLFYGEKWHTICRACGVEGEGDDGSAYGWFGMCPGAQ